jgi:hypothetical protein
MAPPTKREEILARFWDQVKQGKPIVGAGAGWFLIRDHCLQLTIQESASPQNVPKQVAPT